MLCTSSVPEEKLPIEVGNVYCIHVDDIDIAKAHERLEETGCRRKDKELLATTHWPAPSLALSFFLSGSRFLSFIYSSSTIFRSFSMSLPWPGEAATLFRTFLCRRVVLRRRLHKKNEHLFVTYQVFEQLTAKTTGTNDEDTAVVHEKVTKLVESEQKIGGGVMSKAVYMAYDI